MLVWSNTKTLDGLIEGVDFTTDPSQAEVLLVGGKLVRLEAFPKLRGIFKTGVGRDNVPEAEARARGVVCRFPSPETCAVIYDETASFACYLVLRCLYLEVGDFESWRKIERTSLKKRRVLVVGTGNIGSRVVARLRNFVALETYDAASNSKADLEPLVRRADCITLHLPLTAETRGLFDASKLGWMKDGASLVNTARAAIVDETALQAEISKGRLRAAFDVFWKEPYEGPLRGLPLDRFLVSPHVGSNCRQFREGCASDFMQFLGELRQT